MLQPWRKARAFLLRKIFEKMRVSLLTKSESPRLIEQEDENASRSGPR